MASGSKGGGRRGAWGVVVGVALAVVLLLEILLIADVPPEPELFTVADTALLRQKQSLHGSTAAPVAAVEVPEGRSYPLVALLHGKPPQAPYEWNTGVWPSWGEHEGDLYQRHVTTKLRWQAEGAYVVKGCNVHCFITHDQSMVAEADAVVLELINHYKFYGTDTDLPIPWPARVPAEQRASGMPQHWILFHYEARETCKNFLYDPSVMGNFQLTMTPDQSSDIPVSLTCDWGRQREDFLLPPPPRMVYTRPHDIETAVHIADFSGSYPGDSNAKRRALDEAFAIDTFSGPFKNSQEEGDYTLAARMKTIGHYKFTIVSESIVERDWVCPELSQTLLAGSVPIYFGAPNVEEYLPGPNSVVEARLFDNPQALVEHIQMLLNNDSEYEKLLEWKKAGLSEQFQLQLDRCAHYGECRICREVMRLNGHL